MPTKEELIAHDRSIAEIREFIGADALIYQDIAANEAGGLGFESVAARVSRRRASTAVYITGDVTAADFDAMAAQRGGQGEDEETDSRSRLALQSASEVS
jgi:amidophosphoribosyltransferase